MRFHSDFSSYLFPVYTAEKRVGLDVCEACLDLTTQPLLGILLEPKQLVRNINRSCCSTHTVRTARSVMKKTNYYILLSFKCWTIHEMTVLRTTTRISLSTTKVCVHVAQPPCALLITTIMQVTYRGLNRTWKNETTGSNAVTVVVL